MESASALARRSARVCGHGERAPREEVLPQSEGARHRGVALLRGVRIGAHDRGIVYVLVKESVVFFTQVPLWDFLTDTSGRRSRRRPLRHHGAAVGHDHELRGRSSGRRPARHDDRHLPVEFATPRAREIAKPVLELLSGVPTIVYGYFALLFVTPILQKVIPRCRLQPALAGIVMGINIVPLVASISEDAMRAVPMSLREGSFAMGATACRLQSMSSSGCDLGHRRGLHPRHLARRRRDDDPRRAAGMQPNLTFNPLEPAATITAFIVQVALGGPAARLRRYQTIFAAGLTLFLLTLVFNLIGLWMRKRFRRPTSIETIASLTASPPPRGRS